VNGLPVARILGFEVRLPVSWVFIIAIVTVTVAGRLSDFQPDIAPAISWAIGLIGSLGFMVAVIAHELAHGVAARRDGADTDVLVVQFIGSPATVDVIARSPRAEAIVAVAGPLASFAIGAGLVVGAYVLAIAGTAIGPVADVLLIVGVLNLMLAVVSMVPAFPLDGARLVRAIVWARSGSPKTGTRAAGVVGRWAGRVLLVIGLALLLVDPQPLDGTMVGLVGWFLMASARSVDRWVILDGLVAELRVSDAMEQRLETISPQLTLDTFAGSILDGSVGPALPVVHDDTVVGIVGVAQVRAVPRKNWPATRTGDVMIGGSDMPTAAPEDRLADALERLRRTHLDGMPVLDGKTLLGVLTRRSIGAVLHARAETRGQAL
jgi:Zn-dependent protease